MDSFKGGPLPRGSEYPNSRVSGPKIHTLNGFWTLKPYYLGTWTLRVKGFDCFKGSFKGVKSPLRGSVIRDYGLLYGIL